MFLNSVWLPYKNCERRTQEYTREFEAAIRTWIGYKPTFISSKIISEYGITKSTDVTCLHGFSNAIFGDRENCGKFLIELRDEIVKERSLHNVAVMVVAYFFFFLLLETLQLHHTVKVYHVWKLFQKSKRVNCSMQSTDKTDVEVPKKKKRRGKKQHKCYVPKK